MAGYVLYAPGDSIPKPDKLGLLPLASDVRSVEHVATNRGPDGGQGYLFCWKQGDVQRDPRMEMLKDAQTWKPAPGDEKLGREPGAYWIGWETKRPVEPADIYRFPEKGGYYSDPCILNDNNPWLVPVATRFPKTVKLNASGKPERVVSQQYEKFYNRAKTYVEQIFSAFDTEEPTDVEVSFADGYFFAVEALQMNYRINADIIDALGLFEDIHIARIILTVGEQNAIVDYVKQKKTDESLLVSVT